MAVKRLHPPRTNFSRLLVSIQPTEGELSKAKSFATSCRKRLNSSFDLRSFKIIGSHARNEAIRRYSDLDYMAALSKNEAKWGGKIINSDTLTKKVAQDLNGRYVQTSIRRDAQAVVLSFVGGGHSMDVVPALFHRFDMQSKRPVYHIPDGQKGWIETSPEAHNVFIRRANASSQGKLVKTSQLIRSWKHSRSQAIPISSFYISLFLAVSGICVGAKSYSSILYSFFDFMRQRDCAGFKDPVNIAGNIYAAQTTAQLKAVRSAINASFEHSVKAVIAERNRDFLEANRQWNMVFNGSFL